MSNCDCELCSAKRALREVEAENKRLRSYDHDVGALERRAEEAEAEANNMRGAAEANDAMLVRWAPVVDAARLVEEWESDRDHDIIVLNNGGQINNSKTGLPELFTAVRALKDSPGGTPNGIAEDENQPAPPPDQTGAGEGERCGACFHWVFFDGAQRCNNDCRNGIILHSDNACPDWNPKATATPAPAEVEPEPASPLPDGYGPEHECGGPQEACCIPGCPECASPAGASADNLGEQDGRLVAHRVFNWDKLVADRDALAAKLDAAEGQLCERSQDRGNMGGKLVEMGLRATTAEARCAELEVEVERFRETVTEAVAALGTVGPDTVCERLLRNRHPGLFTEDDDDD